MKAKKWIIVTSSALFISILFFAVLMYLCDPLLVFRDGSATFSTMRYNQLYSAPGVARHTEYDSVVTGSCMVGQFDVNQVNELLDCDAIKLTFNGATERNIKTILDICFESHPNIKKILISIDSFGAIKSYDETGYPLPEYLYEKSLGGYCKYLLNLDIFYHYVPINVIGTLRGKTEGPTERLPDHLYGDYSVETVLSTRDEQELRNIQHTDTSEYSTHTYENIENNLIPIIESHPDTTFILYLPPYSILYWEKQLAYGTFDPMMESIRLVLSSCLRYENVKVYSFMWDTSIITNLSQYRDIMHFSADVASKVLVDISADKNMLTVDNYNSQIDEFIAYIRNFDFDDYINQLT